MINMSDILNELGIIVDEDDSMGNNGGSDYVFPSQQVKLSELADGERFTGQIVLGKPFEATNNFDGVETKQWRMALYIMDFNEDEVLEIYINLKGGEDIQYYVSSQSKLFKLTKGVMDYSFPDEDLVPEGKGLKQVKISSLRKLVANLDTVCVQAELVEGDDNIGDYNTFNFVPLEDDELEDLEE